MVRQRLEQSLGIAGHSSGTDNQSGNTQLLSTPMRVTLRAARTVMMRGCRIARSSEAVSRPANFAESSLSTLSHFLNLSVARHAVFESPAKFFFETGA